MSIPESGSRISVKSVSLTDMVNSTTKKAITARKKIIQYNAVFFLVVSILKFYAKIIQKATFTHL